MQPGFQVLYCICKLQINGIARYYVSGEDTSINLNMLVNRPIVPIFLWWQLKSLFPKSDKSTFGTSEKNRFLWRNLWQTFHVYGKTKSFPRKKNLNGLSYLDLNFTLLLALMYNDVNELNFSSKVHLSGFGNELWQSITAIAKSTVL